MQCEYTLSIEFVFSGQSYAISVIGTLGLGHAHIEKRNGLISFQCLFTFLVKHPPHNF